MQFHFHLRLSLKNAALVKTDACEKQDKAQQPKRKMMVYDQ